MDRLVASIINLLADIVTWVSVQYSVSTPRCWYQRRMIKNIYSRGFSFACLSRLKMSEAVSSNRLCSCKCHDSTIGEPIGASLAVILSTDPSTAVRDVADNCTEDPQLVFAGTGPCNIAHDEGRGFWSLPDRDVGRVGMYQIDYISKVRITLRLIHLKSTSPMMISIIPVLLCQAWTWIFVRQLMPVALVALQQRDLLTIAKPCRSWWFLHPLNP